MRRVPEVLSQLWGDSCRAIGRFVSAILSTFVKRITNLLGNNSHPDAQARRRDKHSIAETHDKRVYQPRARAGKVSGNDSAEWKEDDPSNAAYGCMCSNNRVIIRGMLRPALSAHTTNWRHSVTVSVEGYMSKPTRSKYGKECHCRYSGLHY
jgi:hypothetical protein